MKDLQTNSYYKMNNGLFIPKIGFGTYQINDKSDMDLVIKTAYDTGYRLFDTAVMYCNEKLLGNAIKNLPREELIITTKIMPEDMTVERTKESIDNSLKNLNTNYIDLLLIHWPGVSNIQNRIDVWKVLEKAVIEDKKVKSIGVSNFLPKHLEHLLQNSTIKPVVNQIECHPLYYDKETIDFCTKNNILVEAYCPLAEFDLKLIENDVIVKIKNELNKSAPQVILKWIIQHNIIPLPKSVRPDKIKENFHLDFNLNDFQMEAIDNLNCWYKKDWDPRDIE